PTTNNIWTAASEGDFSRVQQLVEEDKSAVNAKDENGYTPLHAAASWKHIEILQYLIRNGGDVNIVDSDGDTPLHICEDRECAALLLSQGADPNTRNHEGLTPVHTTLENEATEVT
ncbi:ankyrin, partial [Coemansia reversa NRRL 1564]